MENEKEIMARVNFKIDQLVEGLRNRVKIHMNLSFLEMDRNNPRLSDKHSNFREAYEQFLALVEKERNMGLPYDSMTEESRHNAKESAVNQIMNRLHDVIGRNMDGRNTDRILKTVVDAIEKAQSY